MSDLSRRMLAKGKKDPDAESDGQRPDGELPPDERRALEKMRREAADAGSQLSSDGEGGLRPSLVLGVMRRDEFTCKVCGELGDDDNGGVGVHHKYQHIQDPRARRKGMEANRSGHRNDPEQMTTICARCHDNVHNKDRDENPDEPDADEVDGR